MKVVAFVTIKINSERVPFKNIKNIGSKPLSYHIVNTVLNAKNIDEVYVYCSDEKIKKYVPEKAIFLKRPKKFDGNEVKAKEIYDEFIKTIDADVYITANTTSPFTRISTVENALDKIMNEGYDSAFSAKKEQTFAWYKGNPINYDPIDIPRTQDLNPIYIETSAFFAFKKDVWTESGRRIGNNPYIQEVDHIESIDIDTVEDFEFAKAIAKHVRRI